jgi:ParB family chromosome partitioning protein
MRHASTLQQLDPRTLIADVDVRVESWPDRDFVTAIRDARMLAPVKAVHTPDGRIRVRYGHRRILAAIEAGRETVPVLVSEVSEGEDDQTAGIMAHLSDKLPASDQIASVGQLNGLGMSAAQIARRTNSAREDVDAAILASSSELAVQAAQRYEFLTVAQAAAIAEFNADKLAVVLLIIAAKRTPAQFGEVVKAQHERRARLHRVRATRARVARIAHPARTGSSRDPHRVAHVEKYYGTETGTETGAESMRVSTNTQGQHVIGGGTARGPMMQAKMATRAEIAAK